MNELLQFLSKPSGRVGDTHPAALAEAIFKPLVKHVGDPHQVDIDLEPSIAVGVAIAAERLLRHHAAQAGLFLGFTNRRVSRAFAVVNGSFGDDPALASGPRHERDFEALVADSIRNHGGLPAYLSHRGPPRGRNVPKSAEKYNQAGCCVRSVVLAGAEEGR
jgi:hypothetical protein